MFIKILSRLLILSWVSIGVQSQEVTLYGDDDYRPYSYVESGVQKGIYSDILRKVDGEIPGYQLVLKALPWKRGLRMLKRGDIAFLYPPYKRLKERAYMNYSRPILQEVLSVFCRKDTLLTSASIFPEDFKGLSVGKSLGFSIGHKVNEAEGLGLINLTSAKGTMTNLQKLLHKELHCYVNDRLSILYELESLQKKGLYDGVSIIETVTLSSEYGHIGITKETASFPYIKDFMKQFNLAIKRLEKKGEIKNIVERYMKNVHR